MQKRTKSIVYIALGLFIAIYLWISSYIFSTTDIQLFIEELLEILETVEGKIYGELIIYSGIQLVFYIISIVLIIKAVIRANFAVPTSSKVYKTCILFTAIIAIIQILKFQEQYTNYLEEIELFNNIGVVVCFSLSIIYYFIYRKDNYSMNVLRMDKEVAVNILEDVKQSLYNENAKQNGLSTINQYIKGLEIAQNEKIQQLINKQKEYCNLYGENDKRTVKLNRKVDEELKKIFSS